MLWICLKIIWASIFLSVLYSLCVTCSWWFPYTNTLHWNSFTYYVYLLVIMIPFIFYNYVGIDNFHNPQLYYIICCFRSTYLVANWEILAILRTSTDFLTQAFIYMAVSLIWTIATVILIVTKNSTGNAPAIFAHKKWTVAWLFWKKKTNGI